MSACQHPGRRGVFPARALRNESLCRDHYRLTLLAEQFPPSRPGQFVQIQCRPPTEQASLIELDWPQERLPKAAQSELMGTEPLLRRPISLADHRDTPDGVLLTFIYRVAGTGTRWLSRLSPDDNVSLLGPLGNGFTLRPEKPFAALVGGGVGIPPMLYLARTLNAAGRSAVAFCGARSASALPLTLLSRLPDRQGVPTACTADFNAFCTDTAIATDDGSAGFHGLVSEIFIRWLARHDFDPRDAVVYSCGPEPMMHAVADLCLDRDIECQLAMERRMACGMGTCQSCVVKIRSDTPPGWTNRLCCTDGPVFDARELLW